MSVHDKITSPITFVVVFLALLGLTLATTLVAFVDLGVFNPVVALAIACTKGVLVVLFFMELRHSSRLTKLAVGAGLFWFALLISLTLADYLTRWWPTS
jgi:cytochrome c oxidase subunit IV